MFRNTERGVEGEGNGKGEGRRGKGEGEGENFIANLLGNLEIFQGDWQIPFLSFPQLSQLPFSKIS